MVTEANHFLAGCFVGHITTYAKKKGENRALIEDTESIEEQKKRLNPNIRY